MVTSSGTSRPRSSSSPFAPEAAPVIEKFEVDDRVCHDSFGLGRIVSVDGKGARVDFTSQTVWVTSPFRKMTKL